MVRKVVSFITKHKKLIWIAGGVALLAAAVLLGLPTLIDQNSGQINVQTVAITRGSITETILSTGVIKAEPSAQLTWESSGTISAFDVKVGDQVKKGDILLSLDDRSKSADILQAQTSLLEAKAELDKLLAADTDYQAALKELSYQEVILLHKYNARHVWYSREVTDQRIEAVHANYINARSEVWQFESQYDKVRKLDKDDSLRIEAYDALQSGILKRDSLLRALSQIMGTPYNYLAETDFIAYDQQVALVAETRASFERYLDNSQEISAARAKVQVLQNTIDEASIIAPFAGTITLIDAVTGEQVNAGDTALQLDDLSNLIVDLDISQMEINKINIGQAAELNFSAIPNRTYSSTVIDISDAGTDTNGETLFSICVALDNPDELVKTGFTVNVSIIINKVDDALLIPNTAIQTSSDGKPYVMVAGNLGGFTAVPIEAGARSDAYTESKGGNLKEGDRLAVVQVQDTTLQFGPNRRSTNP